MPIYQRFPRYGSDWRDSLQKRAPSPNTASPMEASPQWVGGEPPAWLVKAWLALFAVGGFEIVRVLLTIAGGMLSTGKG